MFQPLMRLAWNDRKHILNYNKKLSFNEKVKFLALIEQDLKLPNTQIDHKLTFKPSDFSTLKELYNLLLGSISHNNDLVVGTKITGAELNLESLLTDTDIKVIYVFRDIRDVVVSMRYKFSFYNSNIVIAAWNNAVEKITNINSSNLLVIKHEELIHQNPDTIKSIEGFLKIELDLNPKNIYEYNKQWVSNSSFFDIKQAFDKKTVFFKKNDTF